MPGTNAIRRAVAVLLCALMIAGSGALDAPAAHAQSAANILSDADAARYHRIFALQENARWDAADDEIADLDDRVLLGYVLYQRYMHPTGWRSTFSELQAWMARYADLPGADTIYALAQSRGHGPLTHPARLRAVGLGAIGGDGGPTGLTGAYRGAAARKAQGLYNRFRHAQVRGHTLTMKTIVQSEVAKVTLTTLDHDRLRGALAYGYFIDGRDDWARAWGEQAAASSGSGVPLGLWAAGLASWRQGDMAAAGKWFGLLAESRHTSPWLTSAGAYWAARAALRTRQPQRVSHFLAAAADHPRTFYGLLARRALGLPLSFQWESEHLSVAEAAALSTEPAGRRALALIQVGRLDDAQTELRRLYPRAQPDVQSAMVRLADVSGMASLALSLAAQRLDQSEDAVTTAAAYPVPVWEPEDGWRLDRALLFAFARQESGFNPRARSYAGAHGLMQVLPSTAAFIAGEHRYRYGAGREDLLMPEVSLSLGQKYLEYLLDMPDIDGNLFFAAAAYNGGPGNLARWRRKVGDRDPLLFIESIPSRETRIYVERVLANFWIYRDRMGQPTPSLDMVAGGRWPVYSRQDDAGLKVASRR